jgi:hypothetical protein
MQKGFLVAVVEDCCATQMHTSTRWSGIHPLFERTPVGLITSHHAEWMAALEQLDAFTASFHT